MGRRTPRIHILDQVPFLDGGGERAEASLAQPETSGSRCRGFAATGDLTNGSGSRGFAAAGAGLVVGVVLLLVGVWLVSDPIVVQDGWRVFGKDGAARRGGGDLDMHRHKYEGRQLNLGDTTQATCQHKCSAPIDPEAVCQCNIECLASRSCCQDYIEVCVFGEAAAPPAVDADGSSQPGVAKPGTSPGASHVGSTMSNTSSLEAALRGAVSTTMAVSSRATGGGIRSRGRSRSSSSSSSSSSGGAAAAATAAMSSATTTVTRTSTFESTVTIGAARGLLHVVPEHAWSCAAYGCSGFSIVAKCQCDKKCRDRRDCCHDFEGKCAVEDPESCAAYGCTEFNPAAKCQCNEGCREHGSCCSDFDDKCGAQERGSPLPTPLPEEDSDPCGKCKVSDAPADYTEKVTVYRASCALPSNRCCAACGIWNAMDHDSRSPFQKLHGYLIVPSDPVAGVESITRITAHHYDFLWNEAAAACGRRENYALMVNPSPSRTQHQLHIFYKELNKKGLRLKEEVTKLVDCLASDWVDATPIGFGQCIFARARVYHEMPHVFSEVFEEGARSIAHLGPLFKNPDNHETLLSVGITVMFGCDGKTVVLATSGGGAYCSIEHHIT